MSTRKNNRKLPSWDGPGTTTGIKWKGRTRRDSRRRNEKNERESDVLNSTFEMKKNVIRILYEKQVRYSRNLFEKIYLCLFHAHYN
mmetsp:Transcript_9663/g.10840  ORF Transcript_9663/g.10840 Transcript_9663/m.10840 type:complete len:86 (-) Transcript_9663:208-465(-)